MQIRRLCGEEIQTIYENYFPEAFPKDEIRPWPLMKEHIRQERYPCWGCFDESGQLCTYGFFFCFQEILLLDYLASLPGRRGGGLGGMFLRELQKKLAGSPVLGEVEAPVSGDPQTDALRRRRIGFYLRSGFEAMGVMSRVYGVTYRIIAWGWNGSEEMLAEKLREMYRELLGPERCREHVEVWLEPVEPSRGENAGSI